MHYTGIDHVSPGSAGE